MSPEISTLSRKNLTRGLVQVSLDLKTIDDALAMAAVAVAAGADWLEIGTPLALSQGTAAVKELRNAFPGHPLVADLKIMDGGYGEAALYADAGANAVVVMGRAHDATIERVCAAARDMGLLVMGDDLGAADPVTEARRMEALGVGMVLHHTGHDHRSAHPELKLSPLTDLAAIVAATSVPVQAVGGLSIDQAVSCPSLGAGVVVFGAPLVISEQQSFTVNDGDLLSVLTDAIARVHAQEVVYP
ncbi:MAG TPA: orotidine 5'-phosphate decarboxylase / HUMPS family protein [Trebonia sp.]|nr:orotidine 5'-phosphate decarboxylase / HUMPS family protein [Trebonia sp.]